MRHPLPFSAAALAAALSFAGCPGDKPPPGETPPPPANPGVDRRARAQAILEALVQARCTDPAEPWALVHGVIALGPELQVNGGLAVDALVHDNCEAGAHGPGFPGKRGPVKVEPHPGYFAKNFRELGLPPTRAFETKTAGTVTLAQLGLAEVTGYEPAQQPARFNNEDWKLELLADAADRDPALAPRVAALRADALAALVENQRYFEPWRADRKRPYEKATEKDAQGRRVPGAIHRYFCGGFHFFQAVQRLHGTACPPELARQYELLRVRLEVEGRYWEEKLAQVALQATGDEARKHTEVILSQSLKLLGHGLETWWRAVKDGVLVPDAAASADIEAATDRLATTVLALETAGVLGDLDGVRKRNEQVYLDLVGDGAHALHALRLASKPALGR